MKPKASCADCDERIPDGDAARADLEAVDETTTSCTRGGRMQLETVGPSRSTCLTCGGRRIRIVERAA